MRAARKAKIAARRVDHLTANPAYDAKEERYKVWPTNQDQVAFQQVMDADKPAALDGVDTRLTQAYFFFRAAIDNWLHLDEARAARAEPQAIFETLNANGAPLLPADLIKNWLLWEAARQKTHNLQQLYETYWSASTAIRRTGAEKAAQAMPPAHGSTHFSKIG
jgi:hypothetical protein